MSKVQLEGVTLRGTGSARWPEGHPIEEELERIRQWELAHPGETSSIAPDTESTAPDTGDERWPINC